MVPRIERRCDVDGCGCLDCRNVSVRVLRRTVVDALVWTGGLLRSRPSIPLVAIAFVLVNRLLETVAAGALPPPFVETGQALSAFAFLVAFRAYVGTHAAGAMTDERVTPRHAVRHVLARTPALLGVTCFGLLTVLVVLFGSTTVLSVLGFAVVLATGAEAGPGLGGEAVFSVVAPLFLGAALLLVALPLVLVVLRLWFAVEACVLGGYGPVASLRVSWGATTNYRGRLVFIVATVVASNGALYAVGHLPGGAFASSGPLLDALATSVGELLTVVWYGVYAHLYAQSVLV